MYAVAGRILLLLAVAIGGLAISVKPAPAQGSLQVTLFENPFMCDTIVRPLGTVSGLIPGESVEFTSPQLNGVFSRRVADATGQIEMRWNCSAPKTWSVTVRGLTSGSTTTFDVTGIAAPPPPDAPIGAAFDARSAMSAAEMAIWKDYSPFDTVGVYIPVNSSWDNRSDKVQSNLTAGWVSEVFADGWRIIPIYVGFQAPDRCATARYEGLSLDPATARDQGLAAAADAVASVGRLGIGPGNPIYYDMEAYRPGCAEAVLAFLDAWTEGVRAAGYVSGVYGSRSSTMWDLSRAFGTAGFDAPDAVWVSTGNGVATAYGLEIPSDGLWANARMHQYRLGITRTYGGVTLEIDENIVNAPVARAGGAVSPVAPGGGAGSGGGSGSGGSGSGGSGSGGTTGGSGVDSDGDGFAEPEPDNCDRVANPDQADQDGDGDGDLCDRDIDGDGVDNVMDYAPTDPDITTAPTPTPAPTAAASPAPTPAFSDLDGDGIADPEPDNCDLIANPDQADLDDDGDGDVCDIDIDGDGVPNDADSAPRDPLISAVAPRPEPTPDGDAPTPVPTPSTSASAGPTPTTQPTIAPAGTADDPPDQAEPTATETPQIVVLATPEPTPRQPPTPVPTTEATSTPEPTADVQSIADLDAPVSSPDDPDGTAEVADGTVTIIVDEQSALLPYGIAALAMFSLFCAGMGIRSYRRSRDVWLT